MSVRLDHVQVSCPPGGEDVARAFYGEALGMTEVEKPELLKGRGGCWFKASSAEIHVGVEQDFRPAKKAHPAFAVENLDTLRQTLLRRGYPAVDDENLPGSRRFYSEDPWGNRLEFVARHIG